MIKHIVLWRLKAEAEGRDREANAQLIKTRLKQLRGQIPGLVKLEVGVELDNHPEDAQQAHVALYSVFENRVALQTYQNHPMHKKVAEFIKAVASERRVLDYEMFASDPGHSKVP